MCGATVTVAGAVPEAGEAASQAADPVAVVKLRLPEPVLVTDAVLAVGSAPPVVAENDSDVGDTPRPAGGGSLTTRCTATVAGDPVAPAAVIATLAS